MKLYKIATLALLCGILASCGKIEYARGKAAGKEWVREQRANGGILGEAGAQLTGAMGIAPDKGSVEWRNGYIEGVREESGLVRKK